MRVSDNESESNTLTLLLITANVAADLAHDVVCHEIAFSQSVERQDLDTFTSFIDKDPRFVGASVTRGRTEITKAWSVFFTGSGPRIGWRPQFIEVLDDGKLALSRGPFQLTSVDAAGVATTQWGTFNSVWRLQTNGTWQFVFDAGNAASEALGEEIQALLDAKVDCL